MGSVAQSLAAETPPTVMGVGVAAANGGGRLVGAARPVMDRIASDLAGTGIGIVLSDAGGHVVDRRVAEPWLGVHPDFADVTGPATPITDLRTHHQPALTCVGRGEPADPSFGRPRGP